MSSKPPQIDSLNWQTTEFEGDRVHETIQKTNWDKLCDFASCLNNGLPCIPLNNITNGLHNLVRLLEFSNQTRWIARISLDTSAANSTKLRGELDVMQLVRDRSGLPVPRVFAYEVNENNPVGVPFILMEFIPGNTAMDAAGGYELHRGQIPLGHRERFYRSVAKCHVQMTAIRFPKIGIIVRNKHGEYDIGPFPDIGGPFNTATEFFEAWADYARFPYGEDKIMQMMGGGPAQQVLKAINDFPSRIKARAGRFTQHGHGPFPLHHGDFIHSNMIVNENFEVIAVIDWEGACTLPLELVAFPGFLDVMPVEFGSPDGNGLPADEDEKRRWEGRQHYVKMVELVEQQDHVLSGCLNDEKCLVLAYSMAAYRNGKLGFYNRMIKE
ncbi:hypothetical protein TruAng_012153 [Truncatella angustata]|nr:hypothetical protein TruAng_012153 [Truncatella angustata]